MFTDQVLASAKMSPGRPVFHHGFGRFLERLRERRNWKQSDAGRFAERRQLGVNRQDLLAFEHGKRKNIEPSSLRGLAALYDVPYTEVVAQWVEHKFEVSVEALQPRDAVPTNIEGFVALPLLATPIAAGAPLLVEPDPEHDGTLAFRDKTVQKFTDPICLRVGRHEESMRPLIHPRDIVVIDRDPKRRLPPVNGCVYAVNFGPLTGEEGGALKRIDLVDHTLIVNSDNVDKERYPTQAFMLGREHNLLDILVGEFVWLGRSAKSRRPTAR